MDVLSARVYYPPLFPALLALLMLALNPLHALVTAALLAKSALVIATYVGGRPMGRVYASVAAILVAVSGAQLEAYAWGAYPQLLGTAFGTLAVYFTVHYVASNRRRHLTAAIVLSMLTYLSHVLVGGLLIFAIPIAVVHQLWMLRASRREWAQATAAVTALVVPGVFYVLYSQFLAGNQGNPVLNPLSQNRNLLLQHAISDAPLLWLIMLGLGIGALVFRKWSRDRSATVATGLGWVVAGTCVFMVIGESRALLLAQLGLILLSLSCFQRLLELSKDPRVKNHRSRFRRTAFSVVVILGVGTVAGITVGGINSYLISTRWYRVVDYPELQALALLRDVSSHDDLALASEGHNGNPIGWWVQGFAGIPTYTGVDPRFLTFPDEHQQAQIANDLFDGRFSDSESLETLHSIGADFLVIDRRGPDAGWLEGGFAGEFERIYDSPTLVVLKVEGSES
ncbi:MAG: hypothetical protein ACRDWS_08650 [Acidimicrobiia bacterium]